MKRITYPLAWMASSILALVLQKPQGVDRLLHPWPRISSTRHGIRVRRINGLLGRFGREARYLEIGTFLGHTFQAVCARHRIGVDPDNRFNFAFTPPGSIVHQMTSDDFFEDFTKGYRYHLIYLDGLHEASQTYRDLLNSLEVLEKDGCVLIDDVRPTDVPSSLPLQEESVREKERSGLRHDKWFGDVFKVIYVVLTQHPELSVQIFGNHGGGHGQALIRRKCDSGVYAESVDQNPDWNSIRFETVFEDSANPCWPPGLSLAEPEKPGFSWWANMGSQT